MPAKPKKHKLSDGQFIDYHDVMKITGLGKGAATVRLNSSPHPEVVFAKKGKVNKLFKSYYRKKVKDKVKKEKPKSNKKNSIEEYILSNRPFYADPMYKLALISISVKTK